MADITYYEDDYIATGYYVYTADAMIALGDYIEPEFIQADYFSRTGSVAALVCDATRIRYINASADLSVDSSTTTVGVLDRRTEVILNSIANVNSQADRYRDYQSTVTATVDLSIEYTRIQRATTNFSSIAASLTVAAKNATGTITLESTASLAAIIGSIKQFTFSSPIGVDATSEPSSIASPFLKFGSSTTVTNLDGNGHATGVATTDRFIFSAWLYDPIGYILDTDPNAYIYTASGIPPDWDNNSLQVETVSGIPQWIYHGKNGKVVFDLDFPDRFSGYRHYLFRVDLAQTAYADRYRLFVDGVEKSQIGIYAKSGIGSGITYSLNNSTLIPLTVFDQYQLMMNTSGGVLKLGSSNGANGGGYGDSNGVKEDRSSLAQFWFDYDAASYDIGSSAYRQKFYNNGFVDLGESGTASGLAQPKHYVKLFNYQDTQERGTKQSVQNNWQWKELVYDSDYNPSRQYYTVEPYTATQDQNSANNLQGLRASAFLTAQAVTVLETVSSMTVQSSMTVTAGYLSQGSANLASQVQQTVGVNAEFDHTVNIATTSALSALAYRQQQGQCSITGEFTQTADYQRIRSAEALIEASTTFTALIGEITQIVISMVNNCNLTADITRTRDLTATVQSQATISAQIDDRVRSQSATVTATATLACEAINLEGVTVPMSVIAGLQVESDVVKVAQAPLTVISAVTAIGYKVAFGSASLSALAFELTQGDILNFAPELTYLVPSETRVRLVLPESRHFNIDSETRTRKVRAESRILTPDSETYVNII